MTADIDRNPLYEDWLDKNNYEECLAMGPASIISRKDDGYIWFDNKGKGYKGLCEQKIWEAGYKKGLEDGKRSKV